MATESSLKQDTLPASGNLSSSQYRCIVINTSGQVAAVSSAGAKADGVLQNKPSAAGREAAYAYAGVTKVEAGAAIASAGLDLTTDSVGRVVTATTGDVVVGRSRAAASGSGSIISMLLNPQLEPLA